LGRYGEAKESFLQALSVNPEQPSAQQALGAVTLQVGLPWEARDALREARRLSPIMHNDRQALAVAYGRLLWPFTFIDRLLIRFPSWRPWTRWSAVAFSAAAMLLLGFALDKHELLKAVAFATLLNVLLAPTTFDMAAHATGKIAYRRDLDISWSELLPELFRFAFPVLCHLLVTWLAVICAHSSAISLLVFSMLPHVELVPICIRQLNNGEPSDGGLVFVGIAVPMIFSYYAWFMEQSFGGLVSFWLVSLIFSFLLTVYYRSSAIRI
jgi:tetratricopeptide (TPR) repeat protein